MTDRADAAAEFVRLFGEMDDEVQRKRAYWIAEKHAPQFATPENIEATAIGVRLALLGQQLPPTCSKRWRKGFAVGRAIRDGQLSA